MTNMIRSLLIMLICILIGFAGGVNLGMTSRPKFIATEEGKYTYIESADHSLYVVDEMRGKVVSKICVDGSVIDYTEVKYAETNSIRKASRK